MKESSERLSAFIAESKSTRTLIADDAGLLYSMSGYTLYFMLTVLLMYWEMRSKK